MRFLTNRLFLSSLLFAGALVLSALALFTWIAPTEVMFRSEESRTVSGGDVFNRIKFFREGSRDIWMMNQSHDGGRSFERLAIVVEGSRASFYQLEPGALAWSSSARQQEFKVSCALCHSNGPRAVRPQDSLSLRDSMRVALWNLKIKMYPRLSSVAAEGFERKKPLEFEGSFAQSPLQVAVCVSCHRENGFIARGTLRRQNALAITRMVENGHMPPLGIPFPADQRRQLERFLNGF